jgi:microcystin-dependent protein
MSKTKISLYDADPGNNTDIDGINLAEGMAPGLVNNAIRELMAQLKDFQVGSAGDPLTVGGNLAVTGTSSFTGAITMSGRLVDALPTGTKMLFQQTAAPVGWTKDTANDNKALRVVSGTAGTGGSIAFTTAFGSQNVGDTTLTTAQIPVHNHSFSGSTGAVDLSHAHGVNDPSHAHNFVHLPMNGTSIGSGSFATGTGGSYNTANAVTGITIQNALGSHSHSVSGSIGNAGSGNSHTHTLDLAVQYVDLIICTKS